MKHKRARQKLNQLPDDLLTRVEGFLGWLDLMRPRTFTHATHSPPTLHRERNFTLVEPNYSNPRFLGEG